MNPKTFNSWELGLYLNSVRNNTLKSNDNKNNREGILNLPTYHINPLVLDSSSIPSFFSFLQKEGISHMGV